MTPTDLSLSPWNPEALNGVAVGGLMAALLEEQAPPAATPLHWTRLTIDLQGIVPARELTPRFTLLRPGRQVQQMQVELLAGDRTVARIQALRVREADTPASEPPTGHDGPEHFPNIPQHGIGVMRHTDRHVIADRTRAQGPGAQWIRFNQEVIGGTPLTPLVRAGMAGDFAAGCGVMPGVDPYSWPNLDISLFLMRQPVGEWVLVEAITESAGKGSAVASARLADAHGTFARSLQTVFVERIASWPAL